MSESITKRYHILVSILCLSTFFALFTWQQPAFGSDEDILSAYPPALHIGGTANIELLGNRGDSIAIDMKGDYVYLGEGSILEIFNINDPTDLVLVGKTAPLPGRINKVVVEGNYAYSLADRELRIIDVSNPAAPVWIGSLDTPGTLHNLVVVGNFAYLIDAVYSGMWIVNVSSPTAPYVVGQYYDYVTDVAIRGNYAYLKAGYYGNILVVDVSQPSNPVEAGSYSVEPERVGDVAISGDYAYITVITKPELQVLDLSNPTSPVKVGMVPLPEMIDPPRGTAPGAPGQIVMNGNFAYISQNAGLQIVDISDPALPRLIYSGSLPLGAGEVTVAENIVCLVDFPKGFWVYDVSDPALPVSTAFYEFLQIIVPGGLALKNNNIYIATQQGLQVVDVSDQSSPTPVSYFDTPGYAYDFIIEGNYAYVYGNGLQIVDITDPLSMSVIGGVVPPGSSLGLSIYRDYAYLYSEPYMGDGMVNVIDISNPSVPFDTGYDCPVCVRMLVRDEFAFVPTGTGLNVLDMTNPISPAVVGSYEKPATGNAKYVDFAGNYAYVSKSNGLEIVDISNPFNPTPVGFLGILRDFEDIYFDLSLVLVSKNYAFLLTERGMGNDHEGYYLYNRVHVINVSNPTNPLEFGHYDIPGRGRNLAVTDNIIYLATDVSGLWVLRFNERHIYLPAIIHP